MLDRALIILLFQQIDYNRFSNHQLIREIEVSKHVMERTYTIDNGHISHESIALLTVKKATLPLVIRLVLLRSIRCPTHATSASSQLHPNGIRAIHPKDRRIDGGMGPRQITAMSGSMLMSRTYYLRDIMISYTLYTPDTGTEPVHISWNQKIRLQGR